MAESTGSICLPTYVGIAGGTDIDPSNRTLYPNAAFGQPSSNRDYRNRRVATGIGPHPTAFYTDSGMLPIMQHVSIAACTDGTSNTMIAGEQSDWLRDVDRNVSTKYHGDPGWGGPGGPSSPDQGTDHLGGWLTGCEEIHNLATWRVDADGKVVGSKAFQVVNGAFNVTTVRYKPDLKTVIGSGGRGAPGCAEILGHNNPLQSAHPGGVLVTLVDGSVHFISGTTDLGVLLRMAIRDDGQNVRVY
jgi:hypothetical protein